VYVGPLRVLLWEMEDGRWSFYDMPAEEATEQVSKQVTEQAAEEEASNGQRTVRQVLEDTFENPCGPALFRASGGGRI
jgi:hypothetical protein